MHPSVVLLCLPRTAPILSGFGSVVPVSPLSTGGVPLYALWSDRSVGRMQSSFPLALKGSVHTASISQHSTSMSLGAGDCQQVSSICPDQAVGRNGRVVPGRRVLLLAAWALDLSAGGSGLWDDLLLWNYVIIG